MTNPHILSIRVDENLTFLNANALKGFLINEVSQNHNLKHVVLNCSSISGIDLSSLEMLEDLNLELAKLNICLNLSEIKGPVMDKLQNSKLLAHLKGRVFLTHYEATQVLSKDVNIE